MREFILEHGVSTESDIQLLIDKFSDDDLNIYAVYTNHFYCGKKQSIETNRLLELRLFSDNAELKIIRSNIGTDFSWRYINDSEFQKKLESETDKFLCMFSNRTYDEEHFLDIDSVKSKGYHYVTTGGGEYELPIENAEKIRIRNYLDYDENGIVMISDFRIIGFIQRGGNADGKMD